LVIPFEDPAAVAAKVDILEYSPELLIALTSVGLEAEKMNGRGDANYDF